MYRAEHQELRSVYARALHVLHGDLGNHDSSSLLETSSTSFVRDTGAMVYEIRGLRHRYSVTGRHGVKRRRDRNPRCPTETWWPTDRNSLYADEAS